MRLSPHFDLREFLRSETAARMGRAVEIEDERIVLHLRHLCETVLEPLREALGAPIFVTSGYRPAWLNRAVGGSPTSEHMDGRAADIVVVGCAPFSVCKTAERLNLPFNQLIHEFGQWSHLSCPRPAESAKREALTAVKIDGRTVYYPGIRPVDTQPRLRYA